MNKHLYYFIVFLYKMAQRIILTTHEEEREHNYREGKFQLRIVGFVVGLLGFIMFFGRGLNKNNVGFMLFFAFSSGVLLAFIDKVVKLIIKIFKSSRETNRNYRNGDVHHSDSHHSHKRHRSRETHDEHGYYAEHKGHKRNRRRRRR
jgi:hypothetical protein